MAQTNLLGSAGEHFVMSELLRRGFIAALAPQGAPNSDLVVTDVEVKQLCTIQVKARREIGADGGWHMRARHETLESERLFYCFVDFGRTVEDRPAVFIIPSAIVAALLKMDHQIWLATPGKNGREHKDGPMRRLKRDHSKVLGTDTEYGPGWMEKYKDGWHLLGLSPSEAIAEEE